MALRDAMTAPKNGEKSLEMAVIEASAELKGIFTITQENGVTDKVLQRRDDDATDALLKEIKELRQEIKDRDLLFVEALEKMQHKLNRMEEKQQLLIAPDPEEKNLVNPGPIEDDLVKHKPIKKKGFLSKLFNK